MRNTGNLQGDNIMGCKKIKLFQTTQSRVYSDEYGFVDSKVAYSITAEVNSNNRVVQQNYSCVFIKKENMKIVLRVL